jgi:magnesium transporter
MAHAQTSIPLDIAAPVPELARAVAERALQKPRRAGRALLRVPPRRRRSVLRHLELEHPDALRRLLQTLPADDAARLLPDLRIQPALLAMLHPARRREAETLLERDAGTAGRIMIPGAVTIDPDWTVERALTHLRKIGRDTEAIEMLYVVSPEGILLGDLRLRTLVMAPLAQTVHSLLDGDCPSIREDAPATEATHLLEHHDRPTLPVTGEDGTLVGVITFDDAMRVSRDRHTAVVQKIGGSEALDEPYLLTPLLRLVRKRGGWLVLLFLGEMLTATAMQVFDVELNKATILALFLPLIISSGGNSGSQGSTLLIRAMALGEVTPGRWWTVLRRELACGLLLGLLLGAVGLLRINLWQWLGFFDYGGHYHLVAVTVATALVGVVTWGAVMGAMLPLVIKRVGVDPAAVSAPLVATLVDVTGLVIYFSTATLILRGTLL